MECFEVEVSFMGLNEWVEREVSVEIIVTKLNED
jgi:hypothetical protein